jgi:hypothetical protein
MNRYDAFRLLSSCRLTAWSNGAPNTGPNMIRRGFAGDEAAQVDDVSRDLVALPQCFSFAPPAFTLASPSPDRAMRG